MLITISKKRIFKPILGLIRVLPKEFIQNSRLVFVDKIGISEAVLNLVWEVSPEV